MPTWLRRTLITFAVLLVLAGAAYYWLIVESHAPGDASYAFDIDRVRAALETVPGDKPGAIEVEQSAGMREAARRWSFRGNDHIRGGRTRRGPGSRRWGDAVERWRVHGVLGG